jgi:glycosyltransferase involved in cell wall biosynthesis
MKVLFVTQTAAVKGGVERWLAALCLGLADSGVDVELGLVDGPAHHDAQAYLAAFSELLALPHTIARSASGLARGRRQALRKLIERCRPDIVIPVLVHEVIGVVAECKAQGMPIKLIYPIHENEVWAFDAVTHNAHHIDAAVSVNRLMLEALERFAGWPKARSFHVRAGVPTTVSRGEAREFPGLSPHLAIGFCGKLVSDQKRALDLIEFCKQMDVLGTPYTLWIAGDGDERPTLVHALAERLASGRVRMPGVLTQDALYREFYPNLDALLITSDWETGPLVAWEAMMHGVLIATTAYRGLRCEGLLRHGDTALVYPIGQPACAANALNELFKDPDRFRQIADRGRALAVRSLTVETMVSGWRAALEEVSTMSPLSVAQPSRPDGISLRDWAHDAVRSALGRPFHHGNAHAEWPRYRPGSVPGAERRRFALRLDALELELSEEGSNVKPMPCES